jgi:ribose transport system permease protein
MTTSELAKPASPRSLSSALAGNGQAALLAILLALCLGISLAAPQFYSGANIIAILRQCALVLIVASGMTMLVITAEVDLSVGASLAFVGCIGMAVINDTKSLTLGVLAALAFSGLVGLANGLIVTRLRINSLIATIGTMMILQGGVYLFTREAVQNHHQLVSFTELGAGYIGPLPVPVIFAAAIFAMSYVTLRFTTLGRYLYYVGANVRAARLSGLRSERIKLFAFVVTGLMVGVAGIILSSLMNAGQPTAGRGFELTVIAAVILGGASLSGGRGTLLGTLLGVLILKVIDNGIIILGWKQDLQIVVPGVVVILATYLDILRTNANAR